MPLFSIRYLIRPMEKFISASRRDFLAKKERNLLVIYGISACGLFAGILALIFTHTLANSVLYLSLSIVLGVLLAFWSVFFWDVLFRKNHALLRLQTLSLYAKTTQLRGRVVAFGESLYQGRLPLTKLEVVYSDEHGEHQTSLYSLADYAWECEKTYDFEHYDNLITGVEVPLASSMKNA